MMEEKNDYHHHMNGNANGHFHHIQLDVNGQNGHNYQHHAGIDLKLNLDNPPSIHLDALPSSSTPIRKDPPSSTSISSTNHHGNNHHQQQNHHFKIMGIPFEIKYLSLIFLVVQNSSSVLSMRYSRTLPGPKFFTSTAVVMCELCKLFFAFLLVFPEDNFDLRNVLARIRREIFGLPMDTLKLAIPAILYTVQNNLNFIAISHLDAATFQVTAQLKILTTALFSVIMLHRTLGRKKWLSLFILTLGVALIQLPADFMSHDFSTLATIDKDGKRHDWHSHEDHIIGLTAMLFSCLFSGFAGVFFEKILKGSPVSIWVRNIQLAFYGVVIGLMMVMGQDGQEILEHGFFHGYQMATVVTIMNQALGGLLIAVVVKYADNILKGYATSISIILSSFFSFYFFAFEISSLFMAGSMLVVFAVFLYS